MGDFVDQPLYVDVTRLLRRFRQGRLPTGVDRVCLAYLRHFRGRALALLVEGRFATALNDTGSLALFDALLRWERRALHSSIWNTVSALLKLPLRSIPNGSWVLNMGHSGLDRPGYMAWLRRKRIRLVVMVHDLIPITHPEFCRADATAAHERRLQVILGQAAGIVSNSQVTADALIAHAQQIGATTPPLRVIPLGVEEHWQAQLQTDSVTMEAPYFLMLSTIEPRKNHAFLLYLWECMRRELPVQQVPRLLLIGQQGWMCDAVIERLLHDEGMRNWVTWLPHCSDGELAYYLDHAQALLFPSAVEGYGLPLLEALARGTPVLVAPLPAFMEVAGDIPDYLPLDDENAWLDAILSYCDQHHPRRLAQLRRLASYQPPRWDEHFAAFETFANHLLP